MDNLLTIAFALTFIAGALAAAIPLLLAALGEVVGEHSGVLNLGVEGIMLIGAFVGFSVGYTTGQSWLGFAAAALVGIVSSLPMVAAVLLGLNQIVVGLAVYLAGLGLTSLLHDAWFAAENPRLTPGFPWLMILTLLLAAAVAFWLNRTDAGLRLRAAGLNPAALDVAGGSVLRIRALTALFGGATAALGGAYLSLQVVGSFTPAMTHGLGFLAIVVAMLVRGRIWLTVLSALVYGFVVALGTASQLTTFSISNDVIAIAPFVLVIVVLLFSHFRTPGSTSLGNAYRRGAAL